MSLRETVPVKSRAHGSMFTPLLLFVFAAAIITIAAVVVVILYSAAHQLDGFLYAARVAVFIVMSSWLSHASSDYYVSRQLRRGLVRFSSG